ncbi:MAG: zinc ribbon domain-containing protein [Angelakisella sp.]|jgi:hypothetical protein|nr:zinc ribbon domain-containing protein [Angelakisella sp.]
MAFFEQLGKKITDAGQGVAQQTKNFTEVTRLNGLISDKERQIGQLYADIGRDYYNAHRNDAFPESSDAVREITGLLAEIVKYREEIKQIKGIAPCPACGGDVPVGSAFCPACGAKVPAVQPVPQVAPENSRPCPSCGASVPKENRFCISCGAKMDEV